MGSTLRGLGSRWLAERRRLYAEWERIGEIDAQARTLVDELRRRRDGMPARHFDLWALREALPEVDVSHTYQFVGENMLAVDERTHRAIHDGRDPHGTAA